MFAHLQALIPNLIPMRMDGSDVERYHGVGLARSDKYIAQLKLEMEEGLYPLFADAIEEIIRYRVTIEQEAFLGKV